MPRDYFLHTLRLVVLLLLLHLQFPYGALFGIGISYLSDAVVLNVLVFFNLIFLFFTQKKHQE